MLQVGWQNALVEDGCQFRGAAESGDLAFSLYPREVAVPFLHGCALRSICEKMAKPLLSQAPELSLCSQQLHVINGWETVGCVNEAPHCAGHQIDHHHLTYAVAEICRYLCSRVLPVSEGSGDSFSDLPDCCLALGHLLQLGQSIRDRSLVLRAVLPK